MTNDDSPNMEDWSDEKINRAKFAVLQKLCDQNSLPYPPALSAWLMRNPT